MVAWHSARDLPLHLPSHSRLTKAVNYLPIVAVCTLAPLNVPHPRPPAPPPSQLSPSHPERQTLSHSSDLTTQENNPRPDNSPITAPEQTSHATSPSSPPPARPPPPPPAPPSRAPSKRRGAPPSSTPPAAAVPAAALRGLGWTRAPGGLTRWTCSFGGGSTSCLLRRSSRGCCWGF